MAHDLEQTFKLLFRAPLSLWTRRLRGLPSALRRAAKQTRACTAYDVVGHLAYGDRTDWPKRARMILSVGETQTFPPFDRLGQRRESQGKSLEDLLETFAQLSPGEPGRVLCSATDFGGPGAQGSASCLRPGHALPAACRLGRP